MINGGLISNTKPNNSNFLYNPSMTDHKSLGPTLSLFTNFPFSTVKEDPTRSAPKPATSEASKEKTKVKPEAPKTKPESGKDVVVCSGE